MDQSQLNKDYQILMLSLTVGSRAIPVLWMVKETKGSIGFYEQEKILYSRYSIIGPERQVILMGDMAYGRESVIWCCRRYKWDYRLRLKSNLKIVYGGKDMKRGDICSMGVDYLDQKINIGYLHEEGHQRSCLRSR